ncbi:MAG TPA: YbhB/YbcL family Raf kinase inhibitor-like protein [Thermoanaerobaculia bacterium]
MAQFILKSAAFENGAFIPRLHTCDGRDVSPALFWSGVPDKTVSLVLLVEDPDAPRKTWVHWVLYDLPVTMAELPEGVPASAVLPGGGSQGVNDFGNLGYGGPCPPSGTHSYIFTLYALFQKLGLKSGSTRNDVFAAMQGRILGQARLIGRYGRGRSTL